MLSRQRVSLILAVTLVSSMLVVLGATYRSGETASAAPLKAKILRRHDKVKMKLDVAELALLRMHTSPQEPQERTIEDKIPKHVPIKVKLKAEKEAKFKDLNNSDWVRDFELEVKNTSNKPIYFLELWLMLPETISENNNPIAFSLRFGRVDFIHFNTRPLATDIPIQPGETYTLSIPEKWQQGWREFKLRRNEHDPKKLKIELVHMSFGDGTGFDGGGEAYPYRKHQSLNDPCREGPGQRAEKAFSERGRVLNSGWTQHSLLPVPAAILPVNFFLIATSYRQPEAAPQPDINCPGTDCIFSKANTYSCFCSSEAISYEIVGSSDPAGQCHLTERADFVCEGLGVSCTQWRVTACASPTPTPPTPMCDLSTKPNDTNCVCDTTPVLVGAPPRWSCFCFGGGTPSNRITYPENYGCAPNKRNNGNNC